MKYCSKCKTEYSTEADTCHTCGERLFASRNEPKPFVTSGRAGEQVQPGESYMVDLSEPAPDDGMTEIPAPTSTPKNNGLVLLLVIGAVLLGLYGLYFNNGVNTLHRQLLRDWSRVEQDSDNPSVIYELKLDFEEDNFRYIFDGGLIYQVISTENYRVTSPTTIVVNEGTMLERKHEISFFKADNGSEMMTVKPALTSVNSDEQWFNLGY